GQRGAGELPHLRTTVPRQAGLPRCAVPGWQHLAVLHRRRGLCGRAGLHGQAVCRYLCRVLPALTRVRQPRALPMTTRRWRILRAVLLSLLALLLIAFVAAWWLLPAVAPGWMASASWRDSTPASASVATRWARSPSRAGVAATSATPWATCMRRSASSRWT